MADLERFEVLQGVNDELTRVQENVRRALNPLVDRINAALGEFGEGQVPSTVQALVSGQVATLTALIAIAAPPGKITPTGWDGTDKTGWLYCDGRSVLRSDYADLFAEIGTAFGAADGTHFNLPDLRGRFLRGVDDAQGVDPDAGSRTAMASGGNTGDNVGSVQGDDFKSHVHNVPHSFQDVNSVGGSPRVRTIGSGGSSGDTDATGGNETRPKNGYVRWYIKT